MVILVVVGMLGVTGASLLAFPAPHGAMGPVGGAAGPGAIAGAVQRGSTALAGGTFALSSASGEVGSTVTISGAGFAASAPLTATFGGQSLVFSGCSSGSVGQGGNAVVTDVSGSFACTFTVPAAPYGSHQVALSTSFSSGSTSNTTLQAVDTVSVGSGPWGAAYDPVRGSVYVTDINSGTVSVINDTSNRVVTSVSVGYRPHGIAYDGGQGEMYVANYDPGSAAGTVSVIDDATNTVVTNVTVGMNPFEVAYDAGQGEVYVTNFGSSTVSVISDTTNTVVATISVAGGPQGIAYDAGTGELFVAEYRGEVGVISDSTNTIVANVTVGNDPWGVAYDAGTGDVYATQANGTDVSVISDNTNAVVANVTVGSGPTGVAYDAATGAMLVNVLNASGAGGNNGNGVPLPNVPGSLAVINDTNGTVTTDVEVGTDPVGVTYDAGMAEAFVANQYDGTVSVVRGAAAGFVPFGVLPSLTLSSASGAAGNPVTLVGTGYAPGVPIQVTIGGTAATVSPGCETDATGTFVGCLLTVPSIPLGTYSVVATDSFSHANVNPVSYQVTGTASVGVTFVEHGLGASDAWSVELASNTAGAHIALIPAATSAGLTRVSTGSTPIVFQVSSGQYQYVASASGYATISGNVTVSGNTPGAVTVNFVSISGPPAHHAAAVQPLNSDGVILGLGIALVGALGLVLTAYRYRTREKERGRILVDRLYEVAEGPSGADEGAESPYAPPPGELQ